MRDRSLEEAVWANFAALPLFAGRRCDEWVVEPLGGLTNRNVKLSRDDESYVLRLPGKGTGRYIDRAREGHNAAIAEAVGLGPEILFFDPRDGRMVTRFIENAIPLDGERLRDPARLGAAVETLKRLHRCGGQFCGEMRLFPQLDAYLALAKGADCLLLSELAAARRESGVVQRVLENTREPLAPCHIDPAPHNFLVERRRSGGLDRIYLIDWEYSAMCEPNWDLAGLSIEAAFDPDQDAAMLERYDGGLSAARLSRLVVYKAALDLLSAAWAAVQCADGNGSADFRAFAVERLGRFRTVMADPAIGRHLAALGG